MNKFTFHKDVLPRFLWSCYDRKYLTYTEIVEIQLNLTRKGILRFIGDETSRHDLCLGTLTDAWVLTKCLLDHITTNPGFPTQNLVASALHHVLDSLDATGELLQLDIHDVRE